MSPTRAIQISTDTFAAIWADRLDGENSEEEILRRKFGKSSPPSSVSAAPPATPSAAPATTAPSVPVGYHDGRHNVSFPEGFEIYRHYKGTDYRAKATLGYWLLMSSGDLYPSLNALSQGIGAHEDAWHAWLYRNGSGREQKINALRPANRIAKRHK